MKPLLAHGYEPHRLTFPCFVQPKLNGIRALYQGGHFQSRDEIPFTQGLLDHLSEGLVRVFGMKHYPLDGELYVHGWNLQRINGAVTPNRGQANEDTIQVQYNVFDVVNYNRSFVDRFASFTNFVKELPANVKVVRTEEVLNDEQANLLYAEFVAQGYEGMMYRLSNCPYTTPSQILWNEGSPERPLRAWSDQDNRTWHMLKRKDWQDDEFEFLSLEETTGEKGEAGFVMVLKSKSKTIPTFKVGSGLSANEVKFYLLNPPFGKLVKVKYLVLSADNIPLNPTILAIL